jgi:hypothetical protein
MWEVFDASNILKLGDSNTIEFKRISGTGRMVISDVVLWVKRQP